MSHLIRSVSSKQQLDIQAGPLWVQEESPSTFPRSLQSKSFTQMLNLNEGILLDSSPNLRSEAPPRRRPSAMKMAALALGIAQRQDPLIPRVIQAARSSPRFKCYKLYASASCYG